MKTYLAAGTNRRVRVSASSTERALGQDIQLR